MFVMQLPAQNLKDTHVAGVSVSSNTEIYRLSFRRALVIEESERFRRSMVSGDYSLSTSHLFSNKIVSYGFCPLTRWLSIAIICLLSQELIDQTRMIGKLSHLAEELRMTLRFIRKTAHGEKK